MQAFIIVTPYRRYYASHESWTLLTDAFLCYAHTSTTVHRRQRPKHTPIIQFRVLHQTIVHSSTVHKCSTSAKAKKPSTAVPTTMVFSHDFQVAARRRDNLEMLKEQKDRLTGLLQQGINLNRSVEAEIMECITRHPELAGRREKYRVDESLGETSLLLLLCAQNASLPLIEMVVAASPHSVRSSEFSNKLVYSLPLHMACCTHASADLIEYLHHVDPETSAKVDFHSQIPLCYVLMHHAEWSRLLPLLATRLALKSFVDLKWDRSAKNSVSVVIPTIVTLFQCTHVSLTLRNGPDKIMELKQNDEDGKRILCITWDAASEDIQALIRALQSLSIPVTKLLFRECCASLVSILPAIVALSTVTQVQLMSTTMDSLSMQLFWTTMMKLPSLVCIFIYDLNWSTPALLSHFEGLSQLSNLERLSMMTCRVKSAFIPAVAALLRSAQSRLTSLNITANRLDAESILLLATSLITNTRLERLLATNIQTSSAPLLKVLSESNCTLIECMFQETSEAAYYTDLNKAGRRVVRNPLATRNDLVELLVSLEDIRCIYGLLSENPAMWAC